VTEVARAIGPMVAAGGSATETMVVAPMAEAGVAEAVAEDASAD